jgi:uncharacterized protein YjiS (DUF1127 family)
MTMMRFYLPNFFRGQWYSPRWRFGKGRIELTSLSDYILRDIGVDQLKRGRRVHSKVH